MIHNEMNNIIAAQYESKAFNAVIGLGLLAKLVFPYEHLTLLSGVTST